MRCGRYIGESEDANELSDDELPPLFISLLPVVLPVILIGTNTIASAVLDPASWVLNITRNLGNPNLALLLSAAISILMVVVYRNVTLTQMSESIEQALDERWNRDPYYR